MTVRFCPQCGTKSVPQANFCAACGEALPGTGKGMSRRGDTSVSTSWRPLAPGLVVLSLYLVVGTGLWFFVLRSQPFPSVAASAGGRQESTGGSALPQDHPPVSLPDDVDRAISEYQTVLAKRPDFFQGHFNLGIAYQEKGESDKARESLDRAKTLTTDQNIRAHIDQVLAQFGGSPPTTSAALPVTSA